MVQSASRARTERGFFYAMLGPRRPPTQGRQNIESTARWFEQRRDEFRYGTQAER
jgi:hypothetical protein